MSTAPGGVGPRVLLGVVLAGTAGAATRLTLAGTIPPLAGLPLATLLANVLGSLVLGGLARVLVDSPRPRPAAYMVLGGGFCGGLTTYSTFVIEVISLDALAGPGSALAYALGSLALGAAAAATGWFASGRLLRERVP